MSDFLAQGLDGGDAATAGGLCAVCVFLETVVVLPNKKCRCISVVNTEILMLKGFLFFVWQHILLQKKQKMSVNMEKRRKITLQGSFELFCLHVFVSFLR